MTPDHFTRSVNAGYRGTAEVLGWIFQGLNDLLITASVGVLILAGFALLVTAVPGVVLFSFRERIVAKFCTPYRRPEKEEQ